MQHCYEVNSMISKEKEKKKATTKNKNKNLLYLTKLTISDFQKVKMCNTTEIHRDQ
jgi:hypothetical protein